MVTDRDLQCCSLRVLLRGGARPMSLDTAQDMKPPKVASVPVAQTRVRRSLPAKPSTPPIKEEELPKAEQGANAPGDRPVKPTLVGEQHADNQDGSECLLRVCKRFEAAIRDVGTTVAASLRDTRQAPSQRQFTSEENVGTLNASHALEGMISKVAAACRRGEHDVAESLASLGVSLARKYGLSVDFAPIIASTPT